MTVRSLGAIGLCAIASSCGGRSDLGEYGGSGGSLVWVDSLPPDAGFSGAGAAGAGGGSGGGSPGQGGYAGNGGSGGAAGSAQAGSANGGSSGGIILDAGSDGGAADPDAGPAAINLIPNPGFEEGFAEWRTFGPAGSVLDGACEGPHAGDKCLVTRQRTATSSGPLLDVTDLLEPSATRYEGSAWLRLGSGAARVGISVRVRCLDAVTSYVPVANELVSDAWVELRGEFTLPACALSNLSVFMDGPPAGVELYLDDVALFALEP